MHVCVCPLGCIAGKFRGPQFSIILRFFAYYNLKNFIHKFPQKSRTNNIITSYIVYYQNSATIVFHAHARLPILSACTTNSHKRLQL